MTLDEEYQKIIDDQRTYLMDLQKTFNDLCESEKVKAQDKLAKLPKEEREARQQVLQEQKATLDAALAKLKSDVAESTRHTMRDLEGIITKKEKKILEGLEKQLSEM